MMPGFPTIVGAGPAGLAAAIRLKQLASEQGRDVSVVVLEKGSEVGAHILSGAVIDPVALDRLLPDWRNMGSPLQTKVSEDRFYYLWKLGGIRVPNLFMPPLNLMLARIEQLMAAMREVSDNIAHDLKTPLNRLRNRVEAALREPYGEPVYREALERTIEEADSLIKTFNALLSIARIEAGAGGENRDRLDVAALLCDVAELYEPVAEERGLVLKAEAKGPVFVRADRQLLGQAIANLIDNAIKYGTAEADGAAAGKAPDVEVTATEKGDVVEIAVTDRGPGVPASDRERVLERFVRLEESRSEPGSGLGLSLVAAVARLHGGRLRLEDNAPGLRAVGCECFFGDDAL